MKMRGEIFFAIIFFIFGIFFRSFFSLPSVFLFMIMFGAVGVFIINKNQKIQLLCIGAVFFSLGIFRYELFLPDFSSAEFISHYNGMGVSFEGVICAEPDERISNRKYVLCADKFFHDGKSLPLYGRVLLTHGLYPKYEYGERLKISGKLQAPEPFENFSYDRYLARHDIYSTMSYSKIFSIKKGEGSVWFEKILRLKLKLQLLVEKNMPEPEASIFNAMIFGVRGSVPKDLTLRLSSSGIIHIIAISGSHIMMIIALFLGIAPFFAVKRHYAFFIITVLIIFYIILIGAPASAVRAAIMGSLAMYAYHIGRLNTAVFALLTSAAVMLFFNPLLLRDDAGFQLSFAATWGIIAFSPFWEKFLKKSGGLSPVVSILTMTLSAYITTLPLVLYYFGRLSVISPVANMVAVPLFPYIFFTGLFAVILSVFFPALSLQIFFIPNALVLYLIRSGEFFSKIPFSSFDIQPIPLWVVLLIYALLFYFMYGVRLGEKYKKSVYRA